VIESKKGPGKLAAVAASLAALALLGAAIWFVVWYWWGGIDAGSKLDPDTTAALIAAQNDIPPMTLPPTGYITSAGSRWAVRAGLYAMSIRLDQQTSSFRYRFSITRMDAAYTGDDAKFARLVMQLSNNPYAQKHSGAPDSLIQELKSKNLAIDLGNPPLQISDSDQQTLINLWDKYVMAQDHKTTGENLLNALATIGKQSAANSNSAWAANLAEARALIPPDQEAQYRAAIRSATAMRLSATQPTTRPTTNAPPAPGLAATR
jgi:hypothetical protein